MSRSNRVKRKQHGGNIDQNKREIYQILWNDPSFNDLIQTGSINNVVIDKTTFRESDTLADCTYFIVVGTLIPKDQRHICQQFQKELISIVSRYFKVIWSNLDNQFDDNYFWINVYITLP